MVHSLGFSGCFIQWVPPSPELWLKVLYSYFAQAGAMVFGSGLAIVPFLYGGVVTQYHWITDRQFLDAIAIGMITPGPIVIVATFIGYVVAGPLGGVAATLGVFLPVHLLTVTTAPFYHRLAGNLRIRAFINGVTATAIGGIAGASVIMGKRAIIDWPSAIIGLLLFLLLIGTTKFSELMVIISAAVSSLLLLILRL